MVGVNGIQVFLAVPHETVRPLEAAREVTQLGHESVHGPPIADFFATHTDIEHDPDLHWLERQCLDEASLQAGRAGPRPDTLASWPSMGTQEP